MVGDCFRVAAVSARRRHSLRGDRRRAGFARYADADHDVKGSLNVLEAMRHFGVRRMIHKTIHMAGLLSCW